MSAARSLRFTLILLLLAVATTGCGLVANVLNVMGAGLMPAAYSGLEDQKVAVICVSNSELFGPTSTSSDLATRINAMLANRVKHIQVIPSQKINDWIDMHDWDMVDFVSIGRGVEADRVVAIDVDALSLYDGATMFKGRALVHVVVYDMESGSPVFSKSPPEIEFPITAGIPSTSISEREFRKMFLDSLANRIARNFFAFDMNEDVARDVTTLSRI